MVCVYVCHVFYAMLCFCSVCNYDLYVCTVMYVLYVCMLWLCMCGTLSRFGMLCVCVMLCMYALLVSNVMYACYVCIHATYVVYV